MDQVVQLQTQFTDYVNSLFQEGLLDDQFNQLKQLDDESTPHFVNEVVTLYFEDSQRLLTELATAISQESIDFKKVDAKVHQLKGSSASIGANRVQQACIGFRNHCNARNVEGCLQSWQHAKQEYFLVKDKLQTMFKMEQQLLAAARRDN